MSPQEEQTHSFRRDVLGAVFIAVLVSAVCVVMHHFSSTPDKNDASAAVSPSSDTFRDTVVLVAEWAGNRIPDEFDLRSVRCDDLTGEHMRYACYIGLVPKAATAHVPQVEYRCGADRSAGDLQLKCDDAVSWLNRGY